MSATPLCWTCRGTKQGSASMARRLGSASMARRPGSASMARKPGSASMTRRPGSASMRRRPGSASIARMPGSASLRRPCLWLLPAEDKGGWVGAGMGGQMMARAEGLGLLV